MKRVFDDHGIWNPEAHASGNRVLPLIQQAFDALGQEGYNPREAQALIEALVQEEALDRVLEIKARLEQLRSGHAEAAKVAKGRHPLHPKVAALRTPPLIDAVFTPEHKARAVGLINPNIIDTVDENGAATRTYLE